MRVVDTVNEGEPDVVDESDNDDVDEPVCDCDTVSETVKEAEYDSSNDIEDDTHTEKLLVADKLVVKDVVSQ